MLKDTEKQKIIDSPDFFYFVSSEFDKTVVNATNEEIAQFAFGSLNEAIKEFLRKKEVIK